MNKQHGFSLLEILVVLMLVALVMGSVSVFISTGGPQQQLEKSVERFTAYSAFAAEMATIGGEPLGLILEPPGWRENPLEEGWRYRWQRMTAEGWVDEEQLPIVDLPTEIELFILLEDNEWEWDKAPEIILPIIAFYPSGMATDFKIEFEHQDMSGEKETVALDEWGEVVWVERAQMMAEIAGEFK